MTKDSGLSALGTTMEHAVVEEVNTEEKQEQSKSQDCYKESTKLLEVRKDRMRFWFQIAVSKSNLDTHKVLLMRFFNHCFLIYILRSRTDVFMDLHGKPSQLRVQTNMRKGDAKGEEFGNDILKIAENLSNCTHV